MYLLASWMSSLEKCLCKSSAHFFIRLFLILSCMSYLYILEINPLSVASFAIIFSHYGKQYGDSLKKKQEKIYHMTQQSHYWAYTLRKSQF